MSTPVRGNGTSGNKSAAMPSVGASADRTIAMAAYGGDRPGRPVRGGCHAAKASGVTHTVSLPRRWSAPSYSGLLVTR